MRIGIFGGSFDPIHFGHLLLAECCREQCRLDRVWFVPAANPPHKEGIVLTSPEHRLAMLRLATAGHESFEVREDEIRREGVSYTVETLRRFRQDYPDDEFFLLVGADMLADLPNWREPAEVCRLALPVSVCRPGFAEPDYGVLRGIASEERLSAMRGHRVEMPSMDLSAKDLRRCVAAGQSIRFRTPRAVEEYIRAHGLYR